MKKEVLYSIAAFLAVMLIAFLILMFSASSDDIKVNGIDALGIALQHTGYIIALIVGMIISVIAILWGVWKDLEAGQSVILGLLTAVVFALLFLSKPVSIKTDPKSAGITTEEINYLKSKGLK